MIINNLDNLSGGGVDCRHEKQKFYYCILSSVRSVYFVRVRWQQLLI